MKPIQLLPAASAELITAIGYYDSVLSGLGLDFLAEYEQAAARITD